MDETTSAILDTVRCLGGDKGIVYVTVPITTGIREFQLMKKLNVDRTTLRQMHHNEWAEKVKRPNEADAEAFALMVKLRFPERLVLNPAGLRVSSWNQDQYTSMWNEVLLQFCDTLVVTPDWAFSNGARLEVQQMLLFGREVVDIFGKRVTPDHIVAANESMKERLEGMGWTHSEVDEFLPPMQISRAGLLVRRAEHAEWDSTIKWILNERHWQQRILDFHDDNRTKKDGPKKPNGEWHALLTKYFQRAQDASVESMEGGIQLFIYVSLAVAYLESVLDVFGPLPEPGFPSGDTPILGRIHPQDLQPNDRLALAVAWLRREYFYTSEKYSTDFDDDNTRSGIGEGSWWDRQLKIYWSKAFNAGLDTLVGRQQLGKFVSTAMSLATSRTRLFGIPPTPQRKTGEQLFQS